METTMDKKIFRKSALSRRNEIPSDVRMEKSAKICKRFLNLPQYRTASAIHLFVPFGTEIDTREIIETAWLDGKTCVFPFTDRKNDRLLHRSAAGWDQFISGYAGILEPSGNCPTFSVEKLDIVIVPGMAFDRDGFRMGYGGGYYDRFLPHSKALRVAPAFSEQLVEQVPRETHDLPVSLILTEEESIVCGA